jgi:hypothetical protein
VAVDYIFRRTVGAFTRGVRPEWLRLSDADAGKAFNCWATGAARALGEAERVGAIESRQVASYTEYRVLLENWPNIKPKAARKLAPKLRPHAKVESGGAR